MTWKKALFLLTGALLIAAGYAVLHHIRQPQRAVTTSKAVTAQNDYTSGEKHAVVSNTGSNTGGAIDTHGQDAQQSSGAQPVAGSSGSITLYQPAPGSTLRSGEVLSGEAKVPKVNYRLVDDEVGVIAQGQLDVVNGKYSGKLQFKSQGTTGKLDVFSFDPTTGAEVNNVEVKVNY